MVGASLAGSSSGSSFQEFFQACSQCGSKSPPGACSAWGVRGGQWLQLGDQGRPRDWQAHRGPLPGSGPILPPGEKEGGGEGGDNHILWSPLPGTECAQASLATARALQNSGSGESMCFGKVHFAQEPRKTEDAAARALKSRARRDSPSGREEGRAQGRPQLGPRVGPGSLRCQALCRDSVCAVGSTLRGLQQGPDSLRV